MSFPRPTSLRGQIALLLGASSAVMLAMAAAAFLTLRTEDPMPPPGPWPDAIGIATILRAIQAVPAPDQSAIASSLSTPDLIVVLNTDTPCRQEADVFATRTLRRALYALEMPATPAPLVMNCASDTWRPGFTHVSFDVPKAIFLVRNYARVSGPGMMLATLPFALWIGTIAAGTAVLLLWSAWSIRRPLVVLANAVSQYEAQDRSAPIAETGPSEVRGVIRAFNALQDRLARSSEARICALMGVAHDLRTPLTRLALRVEMGDEYIRREGTKRDIALMKRMLDNAMSLFRGYDETEEWQVVDLAALAQEVSADFVAVDRPVRNRAEYPILLRCQPLAMTRALGNLIENGCRYADNVSVTLREDKCAVVLEVSDDGPGMSSRQRRSALSGDTRKVPRAADCAGHLGLGLPIVAEIVRRHHGHMALLDADPCGLMVRIVLPREPARAIDPAGA
ncbi:MAG: ATP-binding protein [Gluconacetobacter sp.]|uniref:ATP-binding protein n=1 Tax=Gluconacetobacter dulcium TaxID=2729096 RepID=UPI002180C7F6|nr:ATP-binding protein [Gluconacetobacter dulcium]